MSCHSLLACRVSVEKSAVNLMGVPLYVICCFSLVAFDTFSLYLIFLNKFILFYLFLFLAALGLCCCMQAFSSCGKQGLLFVAVRRLLIVVVSLVGSMGSRHAGFSSCGTQAQ